MQDLCRSSNLSWHQTSNAYCSTRVDTIMHGTMTTRQAMLIGLLSGFSSSSAYSIASQPWSQHATMNSAAQRSRYSVLKPTQHQLYDRPTITLSATKSTADSSEPKARKKSSSKTSKDGKTARKSKKSISSSASSAPSPKSRSRKVKPSETTDDDLTWDSSESSLSYLEYRNKFESLTIEMEKLDTLDEKNRLQLRAVAQTLFDEMIEKFIVDENETLEPDLDIYNFLLRIYALSLEKNDDENEDEHEDSYNEDSDNDDGTDYETMAELVLKRMEEDVTLPKPDRNSYFNVMDGWFQTKRYSKVISLFNRLTELSKKTPSVRPDTQLYNIVIRAWMKYEHADGPRKVDSILSAMIQSFKAGEKNCRPNMDTFIYVMETFVRGNIKMCDTKVRQWIGEMMDLKSNNVDCADLVINTTIRNIEIKALAQRKDKSAAAEIDSIFQDMITAARNGNELMKPDGATFVNIMNSVKNNPTSSSVDRATSLLTLANQMYDRGELTHDENLYRIYNAALVTVARSRDEGKAEKSRAILDEMKELRSSGKYCFSPDVRSYNSVLNACAYTKGNESSKNAALRIAVSTFNELRESAELESNHVTYGTFLQVIGNLMPRSERQDKWIETVFKKCGADGHVSVFVLQSLTDSATPELCTSLLGGDVEGEDGVSIPPEWSRKCEIEHDD